MGLSTYDSVHLSFPSDPIRHHRHILCQNTFLGSCIRNFSRCSGQCSGQNLVLPFRYSIGLHRNRSQVSSQSHATQASHKCQRMLMGPLSLLDQSMIPLMGSYLVIYVLNMVMLAGNHALPMMLRFSIWLLTKICRTGEINETLHFLLDHPRRSVSSVPSNGTSWVLRLTSC